MRLQGMMNTESFRLNTKSRINGGEIWSKVLHKKTELVT